MSQIDVWCVNCIQKIMYKCMKAENLLRKITATMTLIIVTILISLTIVPYLCLLYTVTMCAWVGTHDPRNGRTNPCWELGHTSQRTRPRLLWSSTPPRRPTRRSTDAVLTTDITSPRTQESTCQSLVRST